MIRVFKCGSYSPSEMRPIIRSIIGNGNEILKFTGDKKGSIVIKVNLATASQINYHYYTNTSLINEIYRYIKDLGFENVAVVESETGSSFAFDCIHPDKIARRLGLDMKVVNLSKTELVPMYWGSSLIHLSRVMLDAKYIINVPKAKNHDLVLFTGAMKNMYGSIPHPNKFFLFHQKKSGLDVPEATVFVNMKTPPRLHIVDFVESIDGDEVSYSMEDLSEHGYYYPNRIIAGNDGLEIDKYLALKMGYTFDQAPIVKRAIQRMGDRKIDVRGDDLEPMKGWRRISWATNTKAKLQDKIPVTEKMIGAGIRRYKFDACPIEKKEEDNDVD